MKPLTRYWFGDVALARPYLLVRFVLTTLAFDCWLNLMAHGAKYGVGGFNVAHFPFFGDFIPGAPFYLGVLAFTSVLALSQALYRPHRIALALVAMGYTLGWTCSLLDSVPYHYLISLYLGCFVFFPMLSARAAFSRSERAPRGSAWAYVLFCVTTAIVYFYVAAWDAAGGEPYWLPMLCSGAYLVASMQDRSDSNVVPIMMPFLGVAPIAFHWLTPTENWFPIYMIGIAVLVFAPTRSIHAAGRTLTFPARSWLQDQSEAGIDERASQVFYASLFGLVTAPVVSVFVDLPGVKTGCALTAIAMLFVIGRQLYLTPKRRPLWRVASLFAGCLALFVTVTTSNARFDYYRAAAVDAGLRGDQDAAALMREKADQYRR